MRRVRGASAPDTIVFAHEQRATPSVGEKRLWRALRGRQLGPKLRRQHPVGDFALDFYCESARLAVEVDGQQHSESPAYDAWRDAVLLSRYQIGTLRIPAEAAVALLPSVLERISWGLGQQGCTKAQLELGSEEAGPHDH